MRRIVLALLLLFTVGPLQAATKVLLHSTNSPIRPPSPWLFVQANTTQGTTKSGQTMSSIAGPLTGHYFPIATSGYIFRGSTSPLLWFSPPLSAGVTISSAISSNIWGLESNVACNCGMRFEVLRWSVATGGIVSSLGITADNGLTEWGTTASVHTELSLTPTSTAFVTGDRIVIIIYNDDGNAVTEATGRTFTIDINGATGVDGDTYLSFTETITFSADSNNAPPRAGGTN